MDILYHTGQRTLKMTGNATSVDLNAQLQQIVSCLDHVILYPSPYLVLTEQGYTKHYYAGADRVCARLGGGGLDHDTSCISRNEEVSNRVENLFWHGLKLVDAKEFKPESIKELQLVDIHGKELDWLKNVDIEKLLMRLQISVKPDLWKIHYVINDFIKERPDDEPKVYFYHSDHLGGASWITDEKGKPVQHLQYLSYGEPFVNQRTAGYSERFTFTGKEKDEETGYGYFGARYMDHEQMTMWLSVDPMADKYPSISPYAYCAWNPVKLVDPDGMDIWDLNDKGELIWREEDSEKDRIYARDGSYIDMDEGVLTRGQSYTKDKKGFLFHLGTDRGRADEIFEFFADNAGVEFSLIGYANTPDGKESQNFSLSCSFDKDGDTHGSHYSEAKSKAGTLRDHTHNHPDGDVWPSGIPSQVGVEFGTWNPEEKGQDSKFVGAMRDNLKKSKSKGVFQAYIYCPRNSKKRSFPGGYRCYTNGKNQGAKYRKNASSRYSR